MCLLLTPKPVTIPGFWEVLVLKVSPEVVVGISSPGDGFGMSHRACEASMIHLFFFPVGSGMINSAILSASASPPAGNHSMRRTLECPDPRAGTTSLPQLPPTWTWALPGMGQPRILWEFHAREGFQDPHSQSHAADKGSREGDVGFGLGAAQTHLTSTAASPSEFRHIQRSQMK